MGEEYSEQAMEDIRSFIRKLLKEASDKDYQQRTWVDKQGPEVTDYTEMIDNLQSGPFTETNGRLNADPDHILTDSEAAALQRFGDELSAFWKIYPGDDAKVVISHPAWPRVRDAARQALKAFEVSP